VVCSHGSTIFILLVSLNRIDYLCHLQCNLRTCKNIWGKKRLNIHTVKLFSKNNSMFGGFLTRFCFNLYLKVNNYPLDDFLLVVAWKWSPKICNNSKFTKEYDMFANWTVECRWHKSSISWKIINMDPCEHANHH
jgi:hypothetical protein